MQNRYLVTSSGSNVGSRVLPSLLTFGGLLGPFFVFGAVASFSTAFVNYAHQDEVIAGGALFAVVAFFAVLGLVWFWIFRSADRLRESERLALAGDMRAKELAHYALVRVFRGDYRSRAFYNLGLLAERHGDFAEALDLFTRARGALPVFAATRAAKRMSLMCQGHAAFTAAAVGDVARAGAALGEAHKAIPTLYTSGVFDAFFDDSHMGLGAASMNRTLDEVEQRRDPRAMVAFAGALLAYKNGHFRQCVDAASAEEGMLRANLMPHEGELLEWLKVVALAKLSGGEYRASTTAPLSPWAEKARGAA